MAIKVRTKSQIIEDFFKTFEYEFYYSLEEEIKEDLGKIIDEIVDSVPNPNLFGGTYHKEIALWKDNILQ